jgi:multidrug resistance efflux pump
MEKIIFFGLVIPIMAFVLYLGATAIMKGFSAKEANRSKNKEESENINLSTGNNKLSDELNKLNELHQSGALTQEEFEKAKNKLLND